VACGLPKTGAEVAMQCHLPPSMGEGGDGGID
jgi:hypothetical protein